MISSDQVLPDEQKDLEKDVEWDQIANICWIIQKARKFKK